MKKILIALALMLLVLPTAAWSNGTPGDPTFDQPYTAGVADGWTTFTMGWATGVPVTYSQGAGVTGSAQGLETPGEGGVFAVFDAMAGFEYTIGVLAKTVGGDVGSGIGSGYLGIDWGGGEDAGAVGAWYWNSPTGNWDYLFFTGTATSNKVTVFLDSYGPGVTYFDNLTGIGEDYVAPVPEPGSLLALCTGLVGLVGVIRRRK